MDGNHGIQSVDPFFNRTQYKTFSHETLKGITDDQLEQALLDYVIFEVLEKNEGNEFDAFKALPLGFQYVYATMLLEIEVDNGGFNQYFYNTRVQYADEAHEGYIAFSSQKMPPLLEGAFETFMDEIELHKSVIEAGTMEAFLESYEDSNLEEWDEQYYAIDENLADLRIKYIRSHLDDFVTQ